MTRAQHNDSWIVKGELATQQQKLIAFFKAHKMQIASTHESTIFVNQGSQFLTRFLGGWFVSPALFPKKASVKIYQIENAVQIEAHIEESLGFGVLDGYFKKKYLAYFEFWMNELKKTIS